MCRYNFKLKKILVIQTASIGDVILATPMLENLHLSFPESEIDLLVKKGYETLFTKHPFLHEVLIWDKKNRKYKNLIGLLKKIRATRYDTVINIQRFISTGFLTGFSRAPVRIGFSKNPLSFLYTSKVEHIIGEGLHEVERNMTLLFDLLEYEEAKPKLYPTNEDFQRVAEYKKPLFYTISPGSLWFTKQFPAEKWIEFLKLSDRNIPVYFLGSEADRELCDAIVMKSGLKMAVNLSGKLTFLESAALMREARMNFTNDSAPMHLASAVNAPVTAIFCSTIPGFGFGPLSDQSFIIETTETIPCRPCGLHGLKDCPEKHFKCALSIKPDQLLEKIQS